MSMNNKIELSLSEYKIECVRNYISVADVEKHFLKTHLKTLFWCGDINMLNVFIQFDFASFIKVLNCPNLMDKYE